MFTMNKWLIFKLCSFLVVTIFAPPSQSARLGEPCEHHSDCRQEVRSHHTPEPDMLVQPPGQLVCHPVLVTCVCGPGQRLGGDGASCVDREGPGVIIVPPTPRQMARYRVLIISNGYFSGYSLAQNICR